VHHISLDSQDEAVKQFFRVLPVDPQGSVVELNGQAVACVVPIPSPNGGTDTGWTDAKNNRRCDVIDKKYAGAITSEEAVELHALQEEIYRFVDRVAPLPLDDARRLHQDLLRKAMESVNA
jgi:hypothetical protein